MEDFGIFFINPGKRERRFLVDKHNCAHFLIAVTAVVAPVVHAVVAHNQQSSFLVHVLNNFTHHLVHMKDTLLHVI